MIMDECRALLWRDAESHSRADTAQAKTRVLAEQLLALEAQVRELEAELAST